MYQDWMNELVMRMMDQIVDIRKNLIPIGQSKEHCNRKLRLAYGEGNVTFCQFLLTGAIPTLLQGYSDAIWNESMEEVAEMQGRESEKMLQNIDNIVETKMTSKATCTNLGSPSGMVSVDVIIKSTKKCNARN